jgi:hypothetical protein
MVAPGPYPSNAQLSERNAFTIRYCRQSVRGLERRFGVVYQHAVSIMRQALGCSGALTSSWGRLE